MPSDIINDLIELGIDPNLLDYSINFQFVNLYTDEKIQIIIMPYIRPNLKKKINLYHHIDTYVKHFYFVLKSNSLRRFYVIHPR